MSGYYYISNPYNGTDDQRQNRMEAAAHCCAALIKSGIHAFSPIVHNHSMLQVVGDFTIQERKFLLLPFDFSLLKSSVGMIVLKLDGWKESYGVAKEIQLCQEKNIPIFYSTPGKISTLINELRQ